MADGNTPSSLNPKSPIFPTAGPAGRPLAGLRRRKQYRLRRRNYFGAGELMPDPVPADESGTRQEVERLSREVADLREALRTSEEASLRARADLENQRRRHMKEKDDLRKTATEGLMSDLLQPMDHFGLAMMSLTSATDVDSIKQGVEMIHRELIGVLEANGLKEVKPNGQPFDPNLHEAAALESDPAQPDGIVLATLRSGWVLRGKVLRPAMVKVNKAEAASKSEG